MRHFIRDARNEVDTLLFHHASCTKIVALAGFGFPGKNVHQQLGRHVFLGESYNVDENSNKMQTLQFGPNYNESAELVRNRTCTVSLSGARRQQPAPPAACMQTYPVNIVPDSAVSLINSFVLSALVGNFPIESSRMARWPSTGDMSYMTHTSRSCVAGCVR